MGITINVGTTTKEELIASAKKQTIDLQASPLNKLSEETKAKLKKLNITDNSITTEADAQKAIKKAQDTQNGNTNQLDSSATKDIEDTAEISDAAKNLQ